MKKILSLFGIIIMFVSLSACSDDTQVDNAFSSATVSSSFSGESVESLEDALRNELVAAFGEDTVLNYDSISHYAQSDESVISVALFPDGGKACYMADRNRESDSEAAATWKEYQTNVIALNKTITEETGKRCELTVCSDENHHIKLITVFDGEIVYDWLAN